MRGTETTTTSFYGALIEFAQGSVPLLIWENDDSMATRLTGDKGAFILAVANTPMNDQSTTSDISPTIIRSSFRNVYYVALFGQILDVEARGFSRALIFLIAHHCQDITDFVCWHCRAHLLELNERLQRCTRERFPLELLKYRLSLCDAIETSDRDKSTLESKLDALSQFVEAGGFSLPPSGSVDFEKHGPEYFTQIINDLTPMSEMVKLPSVVPLISAFIQGLPASVLEINVLEKSAVGFGSSPHEMVSILCANHESERFSLSRCKFLCECLFSLLSGQEIFLYSEHFKDAESLAHRLAALSPFDKPFNICSGQNPRLNPVIVVLRDPGDSMEALYNLDRGTFSGLSCPGDSILRHVLPRPEDCESIALICMANEIHRIYTRFQLKWMDVKRRLCESEEEVLQAILRGAQFGEGDLPMLKYWSECLGRSILLGFNV
jgi:hypothetical protein